MSIRFALPSSHGYKDKTLLKSSTSVNVASMAACQHFIQRFICIVAILFVHFFIARVAAVVFRFAVLATRWASGPVLLSH